MGKDVIILSSDSEDINEGPSKGKVPKKDINEGPSKGNMPKGLMLDPELAKVFKARPPPALLDWYGYSSVDEYLEDTFFNSSKTETKDKSAMDTFPGSTDKETSDNETTDNETTIEKYVPVGKSVS
nr:hypothetical protein [Tanacetum cinerariifolium]